MRKLDEHKVNPANNLVVIKALDDHQSGVPHHYSIQIPNGTVVMLDFQNGPIAEVGVNGITQEALLAIVLDRLRGFQGGKFACRENALAITKIEEGMPWLHSRTMSRMRKGIEGTHPMNHAYPVATHKR
jgi:hypothetical protein